MTPVPRGEVCPPSSVSRSANRPVRCTGGVNPQGLLDGLRRQARVVDEPLPLLGVPLEGEHRVADEVDRRLEAREQQQGTQRQHVLGGDPALLVRGDERADDVAARVTRALLEESGEQHVERLGRGDELRRVCRRPHPVEGRGERRCRTARTPARRSPPPRASP